MSQPLIADISRIMLFVKDVPTVAAFYRDKLGLSVRGDVTDGWTELTTGTIDIAMHGGFDKPASDRGMCNAKIILGCEDVEGMREELETRGVKMGEVSSFPHQEKTSPSASATAPTRRATGSRSRTVICCETERAFLRYRFRQGYGGQERGGRAGEGAFQIPSWLTGSRDPHLSVVLRGWFSVSSVYSVAPF